ncbi:diguanylate cyclase domain-containing protein [Fusibacter ferrireducens]|uniref:GGDEF domain-containing protein n=1 Tax=Fusibacter ferrireducens TaxID=2785058 RepID=A0ABR9ZW81_9FIRM|nr:diguanylate cyclase [Fusibacter ferrireducens]MBF4694155.1 GGDEF domain-containing protein [Fusibacter ferrireducens]
MDVMDPKREKSKWTILEYIAIIFFVMFIIFFLVLFYVEKNVREVKFQELIKNEQRVIALENSILDQEYRMVLEDLKFLQHTFNNAETGAHKVDDVASVWREFSTHRNIYDQIRFIDLEGDERIRINYEDGKGKIVPVDQLQNKVERYYFTNTIHLPEESIYISQLDLNMENDSIEEPYKPVIRIGTPLYDLDKQLKGIVVLNYLADHMLDNFRSMATNGVGEIVLLNSEGYWLSSENPDLEYSFMFEDAQEQSFGNFYPKEWGDILDGKTEILTYNGLFVATKVNLTSRVTQDIGYPDKSQLEMDLGDWYMVSTVLRDSEHQLYFSDDDQAILWFVLRENSIFCLLILIISALISYLIWVNRKAYLSIKFYSEYDAATKTYNRRAGLKRLKELMSQVGRLNFKMSLCFIDVNGLKMVNDNLGHKYGDELILSAVQGIKDQIRKKDFIVRFGGDEFLVVFHNSNLEDAEKIWQRIAMGYENINQSENRSYNLSVSHGIVEVTVDSEEDLENLIKLADEKMYEEKRVIKQSVQILK